MFQINKTLSSTCPQVFKVLFIYSFKILKKKTLNDKIWFPSQQKFLALLEQWGWTRWPPEFPSKLNFSVVLLKSLFLAE